METSWEDAYRLIVISEISVIIKSKVIKFHQGVSRETMYSGTEHLLSLLESIIVCWETIFSGRESLKLDL